MGYRAGFTPSDAVINHEMPKWGARVAKESASELSHGAKIGGEVAINGALFLESDGLWGVTRSFFTKPNLAQGVEALNATGKAADDSIFVYRGTNRVSENQFFDETGHLLSDAAQRTYRETGELDEAYAASEKATRQWVDKLGSMDKYVQEHARLGTAMPKMFGVDRSLISVTTDPEEAEYFGQGGVTYGGYVPSRLLQKSAEAENEDILARKSEKKRRILNICNAFCRFSIAEIDHFPPGRSFAAAC